MTDVAVSIRTCASTSPAAAHDIVDDVNLRIAPGEVLGLVGESGSGKTTVGLAVLGHARRGVKHRRRIDHRSATRRCSASTHRAAHARGSLVSYVPQDPATALNPALRIGKQILEVLESHDFGGSDAGPRRPGSSR